MPIIRGSGPIEKVKQVFTEVIKQITSDVPMLTESQIEERKSICLSCDKYKMGRCEICTCYMPFKWRFPLAECPIKKWGIHETAQKIIDEKGHTDVKIGDCQNNDCG